MQFLKTLFWVVIAVFLAILGSRNWHDVTMNLWGDIQVDIKLPFLVIILFLIGWLPTYLLFRAKLWRVRTRLDNFERQQAAAQPIAPAPAAVEEDVLSALLNLGSARPAAEAAIHKAKASGVAADFEALFRRSLELVR